MYIGQDECYAFRELYLPPNCKLTISPENKNFICYKSEQYLLLVNNKPTYDLCERTVYIFILFLSVYFVRNLILIENDLLSNVSSIKNVNCRLINVSSIKNVNCRLIEGDLTLI